MVKKVDCARTIDADHGVTDGMQRNPRAFLFQEQPLFPRIAPDRASRSIRELS
jgi:hypothetical protein